MKVTEIEWKKANENLSEWRKNRTSPPALDLYKKIASMVHIGVTVADVGCGQCHLYKCLPDNAHVYYPFDPFPLHDSIPKLGAEDFNRNDLGKYDTVFMLSALDNVQDLELSLKGLKNIAKENIVILTAIDVHPDKNHTVKVTRKALVKILGEPAQEVQILPKTYLFEFTV